MRHRILPALIVIVCLLAGAYGILLSLGGSVQSLWSSVVGPKYKVLDSGVRTSRDDIYWLDNHRVIFLGSHKPKPRSPDEARARKTAQILIWDTDTNKVQVYRFGVSTRGFCYADGYIDYALRRIKRKRDGKKIRIDYGMSGPLAHPKKYKHVHELPVSRTAYQQHHYDQFTCRQKKRPQSIPADQGWIRLKPEHGFLAFKHHREHHGYYEYVYHLAAANDTVLLPFDSRDIWIGMVRWFPFPGGYFWHEHATNDKGRAQWRQSNCLRAWWLYPGGKTDSTCIPSGIWAKYGADYLAPIRGGYVFDVLTEPNDVSGIYVLIDDESMQIISGLPEQPVVSPDGCRIAFAYAPNLEALRVGGKGAQTLEAVNLCKN